MYFMRSGRFFLFLSTFFWISGFGVVGLLFDGLVVIRDYRLDLIIRVVECEFYYFF